MHAEGLFSAPGGCRICLDEDGRLLELGSGAFGRVFKGVRDGVQEVAVKMVLQTDQAGVEAFKRETLTLQHVNRDKNVVQFFGAGLRDGQLWLVTEFMEVRWVCCCVQSEATHDVQKNVLGLLSGSVCRGQSTP